MKKMIIGFTVVFLLTLLPAFMILSAEEEKAAAESEKNEAPAETAALPSPSPAMEERSLAKRNEAGEIIWLSDWSKLRGTNKAPQSWELDDKEKPIEITLTGQGENSVLRLKSRDSAFGVYREKAFDIRDYPYLNWEWKVTEHPTGGSFLHKDTDDQAAQVYISFGSLSFFNKPFVKAVGYYWSSTVPVGTEGECPTWGKSRVIVVESGEEFLGEWRKEKRNVYEDYTRLFDDDDPSDASALRLYTNSQHTKTGTEVFFRNIYFSKR